MFHLFALGLGLSIASGRNAAVDEIKRIIVAREEVVARYLCQQTTLEEAVIEFRMIGDPFDDLRVIRVKCPLWNEEQLYLWQTMSYAQSQLRDHTLCPSALARVNADLEAHVDVLAAPRYWPQ